ncbi:MAG: hypothetical protein SF070_14930 [Gemmatimonadota bacterium]|nr:hypothetical protein [Gemmatimonadota bacterium]
MRLPLAWGLLIAAAAPLAAQQPSPFDTTALSPAQRAALRVASVRVAGDSIRITIGDTLPLSAVALDAAGQPVAGARILFNVGGREAVLVGSDRLSATKPGRSELRAFVIRPGAPGTRATMVSATVPLVVTDLPVTSVEIRPPDGILYAGTTLRFGARALVR